MKGSFSALQLSAQEADAYAHLAQDILLENVRAYEQNHRLPKSEWQALKMMDTLTAYRKVTNNSADAMELAVRGSMVGTVEDALYGIISTDPESMKINLSYMDERAPECRVLHEMKAPTKETPFQYLGIKAMAKATKGANIQDNTYVDSVGIHHTEHGERLGYYIIHCIDLQSGRASEAKPSNASVCFLFKQAPCNSVKVFGTALFGVSDITKAYGNAVDHVADIVSNLLLPSKWVECSKSKKLAWLVNECKVTAPAKMPLDQSCAMCAQRMSMFRSLTTCTLCERTICTKCQFMRKLSVVNESGIVCVYRKGFCVSCIARAATTSTSEVLIHQHANEPPALRVGTAHERSFGTDLINRERRSSVPPVTSNHSKRDAYRTPTAADVGMHSYSAVDHQRNLQLRMRQLLATVDETYDQVQRNGERYVDFTYTRS